MGRKLLQMKKEGRTCCGCQTFKPWCDFGKNKRNSTGHQSRCISCIADRPEEYRKHKEVSREPEKGFSVSAQMFCLGIKKALN